jgi:hypothetical protein
MRECADAGLSVTNTAKVIGCSRRAVRYWAQREGLTFARHVRWVLDPQAPAKLQALMAALA